MGVTIDSIEIEIQSDSANAAKGIDGFIASLESLKKSGKLTTVTKHLNNLSTALKGFSDASRATSALGTLASAIEKLKSAGSIASQAKNLTTLHTALKSLETINIGSVSPKIKEIADALAPLSQVKAGGFGTLIRSLSQLDSVTKSLDDDAIEAFAKKIALLNEKLGPFSEKMATIKTAFSAINTNARSAASGVEQFDDGVDSAKLNMASFIEIARTAIGALQAIIERFAQFVHQASEWDGISARFGRGFGAQSQEVYDWIKKLNEEMGINIQQFMQYSSIYSNMLQGFGVNAEDSNKMALGYTELTYDIWAGYNDIYKTFEEASDAVKSAIAGEVEPIRRAGFTIVESTLAQTAANHGLEISIYNATEAEKSYLRYLTLVDQAHAQSLVGTYAKELNTAEGLMRTFSQQLKTLSQAFGSLFLPILVRVMPYVQAFVELLTEAVYWLANLFGVDIQPVDFSGYEAGAGALDSVKDSASGATDSINDATKAAKELKNATLGIDELNVISPNSATGGGANGGASGGGAGGGGFEGLDVNSLWDQSIFDNIQSNVDEIKEKFKKWLPVIATIATAFGGLRLLSLIGDMEKIGDFKAIKKIKDFAGNFKAFLSLAKEGGIFPALAAAFPKIANGITKVGKALSKTWKVVSTVFKFLGGGSTLAAVAVIAAIASAIYYVVKNFDDLKAVFDGFIEKNIAPKLEEIRKHFDKMKEVLRPLTDVLKQFFGWLKTDALDGFKVALGYLGKAFEVLGGVVTHIISGVLAGVFSALVTLIEGVVQVISGFVQTVTGIFQIIIGLVTLDGEKIKTGFKNLISGIGDIFGGLWDAVVGSIVEFFKGVVDWFTELWDVLVGHSIVPDTINDIVEWFTGLPGRVLGVVGDFVKGVVDKFANLGKSLADKFSSAWEAVKTWWSKKPSLSSYVPSIGDIASKLSSAWESAKTWWNNKKTALKSYTPSIGSIYESLKTRWDNARTWWNDKKTKAKEYTPSIGSIYEKLSERWKNARDWWNGKKASLSSYTPSIGSITDKLKSAWSSAKSWWNKNVGGLSTKLNVSVPKIEVKWKTAEAFGKSFRYPTGFSLKFAANGGIFDQGSLIWAGERGPEIMANAGGGKTGVMNVQQMSEAMYEAVYSATIAANRASGGNNGGGGVTKVYLDGREIATSVQKHQYESGANIMSFSF